jgi:hypothetical protein
METRMEGSQRKTKRVKRMCLSRRSRSAETSEKRDLERETMEWSACSRSWRQAIREVIRLKEIRMSRKQ